MPIKPFSIITAILLNGLTLLGQDIKQIAKDALNYTVSVITLDKNSQTLALGSGFAIDNEHIVTNVHVIEGGNSVYILKTNSETRINCYGYVAIDKANDLVILKVENMSASFVKMADTILPEIGERIYAMGNPKGLSGTFSEGIVSGRRNIGNSEVIQITAPISPGSSGGPVLNSKAELIGIAFASYTAAQNLNFAVPVKYLITLRGKIGVLNPINEIKPRSKQATSENTVNPNVAAGVTIRNIKPCAEASSSGKISFQFSIMNNLSYKIGSIKVLFLSYDNTGVMVDYGERTFVTPYFSYEKKPGIEPNMARTIGCYELDRNLNSSPELAFERGYSIKTRVLDFEILEK